MNRKCCKQAEAEIQTARSIITSGLGGDDAFDRAELQEEDAYAHLKNCRQRKSAGEGK